MRFRIALLTLACALGVCGWACADEGNWFTRMFTPGSAKKEIVDVDKRALAKTPDNKDMPPIGPAPGRRALDELERRQDVCQKLRDIAEANGDEEMLRKVEQLDQRAWDIYVASSKLRPATTTTKISLPTKGGR